MSYSMFWVPFFRIDDKDFHIDDATAAIEFKKRNYYCTVRIKTIYDINRIQKDFARFVNSSGIANMTIRKSSSRKYPAYSSHEFTVVTEGEHHGE